MVFFRDERKKKVYAAWGNPRILIRLGVDLGRLYVLKSYLPLEVRFGLENDVTRPNSFTLLYLGGRNEEERK